MHQGKRRFHRASTTLRLSLGLRNMILGPIGQTWHPTWLQHSAHVPTVLGKGLGDTLLATPVQTIYGRVSTIERCKRFVLPPSLHLTFHDSEIKHSLILSLFLYTVERDCSDKFCWKCEHCILHPASPEPLDLGLRV